MKYEINPLKEYIDNSLLVTVTPYFKIRLAKDLFEKYKNGLYDKRINALLTYIDKIRDLNIKYPYNSNPVFYLYIVPDDNFKNLLKFPSNREKNGGGKPVTAFDLDSFPKAYGVSNNLLENKEAPALMGEINNIHELSHLIQSIFFTKNRFISEGFAECLPLYTLEYEDKFDKHIELLKTLKGEDLYPASKLIQLEKENNFDNLPLINNMSVSFELSYISSYLFVRVCIERIEALFSLDRKEATQKFLEIVKSSQCTNEWLVYDIATSIKIPKEKLLKDTDLQFSIIKKLKASSIKGK